MTAAKTVFVVGAGASCEYGFPSGIALKQSISSSLARLVSQEPDTPMRDVLDIAAHKEAKDVSVYVKTAQEISRALPLALSIDNYLHTHRGDKVIEQVGKLAIVQTILNAERRSKLYFKPTADFNFSNVEDTWLTKLMQLLNESNTIDSLKARLASITFVVFNYDRCIEHFLFNAIKTFYGVPWDVAAEVAMGIRIYHPYGTVGEYPFNPSMQAAGTPYGADLRRDSLLEVAQGIKTFTEGTDDRLSDILAIREHIANASKLIFLGFAFHPINIELLARNKNTSMSNDSSCFGTVYGMSESNMRLINEDVTKKITGITKNIFQNMTCAKMFDDYSRTFRFD